MKARHLCLPTLLLLLVVPLAVAQEGPESAESDPAETFVVPREHDSARSTMGTFLDSVNLSRPDLDVAAACLDLSEIRRSLRAHKGPELVLQLKDVLDRTAYIEVEELSDASDAPPYQLDITTDLGKPVGRVVIAPDDRGEWLFDTETVREIPRLWAEVSNRETVEGVTEVDRLTTSMWLRSKMPESLQSRSLWMEHWQWLFLLLLLVTGWIVDRVVASMARSVADKYLRKRFASIEPERLKSAMRPVGLIAAALFWWFGIFQIGLPAKVLDILSFAVKFVGATAFVWAAYRLVDVLAVVLGNRAKDTGNKYDDLLVPMVTKVAKLAIAVLGLLFIADSLDLPVSSILAGVGIGGLAVALAAQDLVKNLFGSLLVVVDQPFSVGDYVQVGGIGGTVEELGFRSTRIRTPQNSLVTYPNSNLITSAVDNLGARTFRRWKTMLSLTYDTPPDRIDAFCEGVRELIRNHPYTRKEGFYVHFVEFSPSSLDVLLQLHFDVPDWATELKSKQEIGLDILRLAEELGVEMAFPTQTVHVQGVGPEVPPRAETP